MAKAIMLQGTGSNVGKSLLVAGLVRAFSRKGLRVRPFKPQNMSNNAAVTVDGGEIGRAQALQARAAGVAPHTDMNPVLLKPQSETGAQIILQGKVWGVQDARSYGARRDALLPYVLDSFHRLCADSDLVVVEGAGSPAETNLRARDIANMGFARAVGLPVILIGDIDRGGVIAQVVGTQAVIAPEDAALIRAFLINKFQGDVKLFDEGRDDIAGRTGWPCLGVVPWFSQARDLPAEDVMDLPQIARSGGRGLKVVVPRLPRISNFDDLDPLAAEPNVKLSVIEPGHPLPRDADVVLLVGSKATLADLAALRAQGWDTDIASHLRHGGHVLGLCGGYQMLGQSIADPSGLEGSAGTIEGLGHLAVDTRLQPLKHLSTKKGIHLQSGASLSGYEIHMGETDGADCARPWLSLEGERHGASSADGRVLGCYLHGIFSSDAFRSAWLAGFGQIAQTAYHTRVEAALDALADHLGAHIDHEKLLSLAEEINLPTRVSL
ncbi:MAG: cobyric acid synthase [Pseudomonadota bacterium]